MMSAKLKHYSSSNHKLSHRQNKIKLLQRTHSIESVTMTITSQAHLLLFTINIKRKQRFCMKI